MQSQGHRARASLRLLVLAVLAAGVLLLPLSMPCLRGRRDGVKAARAAMRGASLTGASETVMQARGNDCGAACLKMVLAAHGIERSLSHLTGELGTAGRGTSMLNLRLVATRLGLPARSWKIECADLSRVPLPAIVLIDKNHFVVIRRFIAPEVLEVDDPALGRLSWPVRSFRRMWHGQALIFDPAWAPS